MFILAEFIGPEYCAGANVILKRLPPVTFGSKTWRAAEDLCVHPWVNATRIFQLDTYNQGCGNNSVYKDNFDSWVVSRDDKPFDTKTGRPVDTSKFIRYNVICEYECKRTQNDNIDHITKYGIVHCAQGYEYKHRQPVCQGTKQVEACTLATQ
eukprot:scpid108807/ scgid2212/ 